MAYWRMQLDPSDRARATEHTGTSLSRGYIGLELNDFWSDLTTVTQNEMAEHPSYWVSPTRWLQAISC